MRIGITCYPSFGGSGVLATELGLELAKRGHVVHFITYEPPARLGGYQPNVVYHQVDIPTYPLFRYPPYLLALTNKMIEVARFCRLDILHVHYAIPHATSAVLARQVLGNDRPRVVTTLHGTDVSLLGTDPGFYELLAWSIEQSDGVTAVSGALAAETRLRLPVEREIEVIHNFVNTDVYKRRRCESLCRRMAGDEKLIGHVSNFRPVKRPQDVVRVFAGIAAAMPARLLLVGDGPEIKTVRDVATELGVIERVEFLGTQEQVADVLSCLDLFLLPSAQESFGLAALEAMACGTPVLAYRVGGLPEVVLDGHGGFLHADGDVAGMVDRAVGLLRDDALWHMVSEAGVARVNERFRADLIVPQYEEYYTRVSEGTRLR